MQDDDILDAPPPQDPRRSDADTRRISRYLLYALGLVLLLLVRLYWVLPPRVSSRNSDWIMTNLHQTLLIGLSGLWLFAGLGLTAGIRTARRHPLTGAQMVYTVIHGLLLVGSSGLLWMGYRSSL